MLANILFDSPTSCLISSFTLRSRVSELGCPAPASMCSADTASWMSGPSDLMAVDILLANRSSYVRQSLPFSGCHQVLLPDVAAYVLKPGLDVGAMELDHAMYIKGEVKIILSYVERGHGPPRQARPSSYYAPDSASHSILLGL